MVMEAQDTEIMPGYKLTEMGVIPEDWKPTPLGLLSAFITKGATPTTYGFSWVNDGVLFLRSECVSEQGLDLTQSMFITSEAHNVLKRGEVLAEDILITITGNVGRVIYLSLDFKVANINQHIARIRIVDNNVVANYIFHFLSQAIVRKYYGSITTGQAYPQISLKQVRETRIPLPPLPEQHAIATVLSDVDALITSLDKLIAKKRDIKQATMQQLLTGKTRLPGFSGEWEVKKIGEIGQPYGGLSGKSKENFVDGQYPYIPFLNIMNNPIIDINYFDYVNIASDESQNKAIKGDLFFNGSSETPEEVGMCSVLNEDISNLYLNSFCFGFRLNKELKTNGLYLSYYFRSSIGRQLFYSQAQGATRYNLSKSNFLKMKLPYPEFEEQTAIATVLSDMDAEIAALEQKRKKTRMLKQGMMQELLTGKTRLI